MLADYFEIETKVKGCIFKDCVNFLYEIFPNGSWRFDRKGSWAGPGTNSRGNIMELEGCAGRQKHRKTRVILIELVPGNKMKKLVYFYR